MSVRPPRLHNFILLLIFFFFFGNNIYLYCLIPKGYFSLFLVLQTTYTSQYNKRHRLIDYY
uniref:Uncharacterized protein n=1 Tax=Anguilla anguilla TaxID=7936 RepID=A0A0E9QAP1_ANGAN